jgi:uncharacterized membrane protein (UPF0136 family)
MMQFENIVFWCFIVLLLVGGLIGFRAGSKVSLITSAVAAAALVLTQVPRLLDRETARELRDVIMAVLLVVFAIRLVKTKRFFPAGFLLVLTGVVLALLNIWK